MAPKKDMDKKPICRIIGLCLETDRKAAILYGTFAQNSANDELKRFWRGLAAEEGEHVVYWKTLQKMACAGAVPELFDNPGEIIRELKATLPKIQKILDTHKSTRDVHPQFLSAYRLEFFMMHHAFAALFHLLKNVSGHVTPADDYELHLSKFIGGMRKFGSDSPELDLIGESLTRLWAENRKLVVQSTFDALTGVMNRQGFIRSILPLAYFAQRNSLTVGVMMVDIDNFKTVNDTYGHQAGDAVLTAVAGVIQKAIRRSDVVCRFGGEEFLVYLPDVQSGATRKVGEKVRRAVEKTAPAGVKVTVSVGCVETAIGKTPQRQIQNLIKLSDKAMYAAKAAGKNRVEETAAR